MLAGCHPDTCALGVQPDQDHPDGIIGQHG